MPSSKDSIEWPIDPGTSENAGKIDKATWTLQSEAHSLTEAELPSNGQLSNADRQGLEGAQPPLVIHGCMDDVKRLRDILHTKSWIGFDLDDTLHEFRSASRMATDMVLDDVHKHYGIAKPQLQSEYNSILREMTANAFSDGKTSFDYRRERFAALLDRCSLPQDAHYITGLLRLYENKLTQSLELKRGALDLLTAIKGLGKQVVIITEGPQDAQERTVRALGIEPFIDFLATTNQFRVSKTDGLYDVVLQRLGIKADDIAYVGDSEKRDMEPALARGIFCLHYEETNYTSLNTVPPRLNTLIDLKHILCGPQDV